ncbi:putative F-box/kelch-repeat protein-like protein [Tanacetum coccineum]
MELTNKYIAIKAQIDGAPQESDFEVKTESISLLVKPGSKDIIIKNLYVSIDPYQLNRMKTVSASQKASEYAVGIVPGEVIDAYGVGKVVASDNPDFEKGDYVVGLISWGEYSISQGMILNKLNPMGFPLSYHVGVLEGIDVYFDNVGGEMLEAAVSNMNLHGRVAVCGVISEYTNTEKRAAPDMLNVIYKRITIQGFLAGDYLNLFPEFLSTTIDHIRTGKMHVLEDVSIGVECVPSAFVGLYSGYNVGKKIVKLADE